MDDYFFSVSYASHEVILIPHTSNGYDSNPLTAHNGIDEFYITIVPKSSDIEYDSYKFTYDPSQKDKIVDTANVANWDVIGQTGLDVYPNLDAFYFTDLQSSTFDNFVSYASQVASYLNKDDTLKFDLEGEFDNNGDFNQLLDDIRLNKFMTIFIDANIQNYESLERLDINLLNSANGSISSDSISIEDLVMNEFELSIDISSTTMASLRYIELAPIFRTDDIYSTDNILGDVEFEFLEWDEELTFFNESGNKFMKTPLLKALKTDNTPIAYLFNDELKHLDLPASLDFSYEVKQNEYTKLDEYTLNIPNTYLNPDNPIEELEFKDG
ncbi:hypothetical protein LCGC14_2087230, partial [marine sediment metagenome]